MRAVRVSHGDYFGMFPEPMHVFNSPTFALHNRAKADDLHFVAILDDKGKPRFGIILGEKNGVLRSPFSAPFGGMECDKGQRIDRWIEGVEALKAYSDKEIVITLPPTVYETPDERITRQLLAIQTCGGRIMHTDYNYSLPLPDGHHAPWPNARRNLATATRWELTFREADQCNVNDLRKVYDVVSANHTAMGYPVHMSFNDVVSTTSEAVSADFFLLEDWGKAVASAMIYRTAQGICQLIYWGDLPEAREMRPMNLLATKIAEWYAERGYREFDLGPASSDGIPSTGLCDFKESIGCRLTPKVTVELGVRS